MGARLISNTKPTIISMLAGFQVATEVARRVGSVSWRGRKNKHQPCRILFCPHSDLSSLLKSWVGTMGPSLLVTAATVSNCYYYYKAKLYEIVPNWLSNFLSRGTSHQISWGKIIQPNPLWAESRDWNSGNPPRGSLAGNIHMGQTAKYFDMRHNTISGLYRVPVSSHHDDN